MWFCIFFLFHFILHGPVVFSWFILIVYVQKEEACQRCGKSDNLVSCSTCTYAFHRKCLVPCLNIASDKWSCPECVCLCLQHTPQFQFVHDTVGVTIHLVCCIQVSPLTEMEKILDCEMRDAPREDTSSSEPEPKKMKHYLIKWKGLSHIHCSW